MQRAASGAMADTNVEFGCDRMAWLSPAMREVENELGWAATCDVNLLISGEPGSGKKAAAYRVHRDSIRADRPFVVVDAADYLSSTPSLVAKFNASAPDGTLLLDHPQGMSAAVQSLLLEFIEGDANHDLADGHRVRFLTVTSPELFSSVALGQFADALFYRLNTIHIIMPPLRERREDVPLLLEHFLAAYRRGSTPRLSEDAWEHLVSHAWPGNIKELQATAAMMAGQDLERPFERRDLLSFLMRAS